jgi:hypothetical protein
MTIAMDPTSPGTAALSWTCKVCGINHHPALIGHGSQRFNGHTAGLLKLRLTPTGDRLLKLHKPLHLVAKATFTPTGKAPLSASRTLTIT